jgi:hypothetical protein
MNYLAIILRAKRAQTNKRFGDEYEDEKCKATAKTQNGTFV